MAVQTVNLNLNTPFVMVGTNLGQGLTYTYTVNSSPGLYRVSLETMVLPGSALAITVKQNGSTVYTAPVIAQTQTALQFQTNIPCDLTDIITVNLTSSAAQDAQINNIKTTCQIMNGL